MGAETPGEVAKSPLRILTENDEVKQIFDLVCEVNPSKYSQYWKMNDQDRSLILKAIDELGFVGTQLKVYQTVDISEEIPYFSISKIFADIKYDKPEGNFLEDNQEIIPDLINNEFSDSKVMDAQTECEDANQFYDFIRNAITLFHQDAKHWKPSEEDLAYCEQLRFCDSNIPLAEKLRSGLQSAIDKDEWRFGQVVYQAISAIESREIACSQ